MSFPVFMKLLTVSDHGLLFDTAITITGRYLSQGKKKMALWRTKGIED